MVKISVLMPVYNTQEEWLREAIESILNQTFRDFEFIIINDGSTNKKVEKVIKSYKDKRIKYFKKTNTGIADSLNFGWSKAKGEYIARMDSDDISLPQRFSEQVDFLEKNKEVSVLGTSFRVFPIDRTIIFPNQLNFLDLISGCQIAHPTVMLRREDFEKFGLKYDTSYKCEDYELWSRAIKFLKFANLKEVMLLYRWHDKNISKPTDTFNASVKKVQQNMLDFLTDNHDLQQTIITAVKQFSESKKCSFLQKIFSLKNQSINGEIYKILVFFGIKVILWRK